MTSHDEVQRWYCNGELHRESGPAVIYPDGTREWWWQGQRVNELVHRMIANNFQYRSSKPQ